LHNPLDVNESNIDHYSQDDDDFDESNGCEVFLLGTSHISSSSCEDVRLLMECAQPDCLFLELCPQRLSVLEDAPPTQPIYETQSTIPKEIEQKHQKSKNKNKKPSMLEQIKAMQSQTPGMSKSSALSTVLFTEIQSDYALKLNMTIGAEFREAFQCAIRQRSSSYPVQPCQIILGDRPVMLSLLRTWESLNFFARIKLMIGLFWSLLPFNQPSAEEIKEWMDSILRDGGEDALSKSMKELSKHFPTVEQVIIHERDRYMYAKLNQLAQKLGCKKIVAVVGAGHCAGIRGLVERQKLGVKYGYYRRNDENYEDILKEIIETKKFKVDQAGGEMKSLLSDLVELEFENPIQRLPYPYADQLPNQFVEANHY